MIKKKYKFEAAYVDENGLQGSSFEMFVTFGIGVSKEILERVDKFIDQFDHSTMYAANHIQDSFLSQSRRRIVLSDIETKEITSYVYAYLTYFSLEKADRFRIRNIEISDTKDTSYIITRDVMDSVDILNLKPSFKIYSDE